MPDVAQTGDGSDGDVDAFVTTEPFRKVRCTALCEIRHGERPGCATHPTHTNLNQSAAGQSPNGLPLSPSGIAVRDEAVGFFEHSGRRRVWLTPLCPAGHLPLKGGDRQDALSPLHFHPSRWPMSRLGSISPLEGEMPGRAEGGKAPTTPAPLQIAQPPESSHPVTNPSDSCATD